MTEQLRPLTEGMVSKGGLNDWPSQVTERSPAPGAIRSCTNFSSAWSFGQRVWVDDDASIVARITGFCFRTTRDPTVEVSYFHNGESKAVWVEEFRLKAAA